MAFAYSEYLIHKYENPNMAHDDFIHNDIHLSSSSHPPLDAAALQQKLRQSLGPEFVSTRPGPGGPKLTYVEGWKIINLANDTFGFDGWSSNITSLTIDYADFDERTKKFSVGVSAIVRITLTGPAYAGVYREDTGFGMIDNAKSKGQAFEKCKKEAVTDALKRSFRQFGNLLGNCFYDKAYTHEVQKIKILPQQFDKSSLHRRAEYADPPEQKPSIPTSHANVKPTIAQPRPPLPPPPKPIQYKPSYPAPQPPPPIQSPMPPPQLPQVQAQASTSAPTPDDEFDEFDEFDDLLFDEGPPITVEEDTPIDTDVTMSFDPPQDADRSILGERLAPPPPQNEMPPPSAPVQPKQPSPEQVLAEQRSLRDQQIKASLLAAQTKAKMPAVGPSSSTTDNGDRSVAQVRFDTPSASSSMSKEEQSKVRLAKLQRAMEEEKRKKQLLQQQQAPAQTSQRRPDTPTGEFSFPQAMKRGADGMPIARKPGPGMGLSAAPGRREPLGTLPVDTEGNMNKRVKR